MRYVVTGADGFIASHLCERLLADGHEVVAFCHYHGALTLSRLREHARLSVVWGECQSYDTLDQMPRDGIEGVFHLAAAVDVAWSLRLGDTLCDETYYFHQNVRGTEGVLRFAASRPARCLVMSSSEVYGTPDFVPISEQHRISPQSPYAASKKYADVTAWRMAQAGYDVVIARPFNTYGPRQSPRSVIGKMCIHAARGSGPVELGDVETKRDWVYVTDTVDGLVRIMASGRRGETYNLGTGRAVTVREAAQMIGVEYVSGRGQDRGAAEVLILQADATKARETLGWEPKVRLEDGLAMTVESYRHG